MMLRASVRILFLSFVLIPLAAVASTYEVYPDGSGDFPTIQAAINAAVAGDVILLGDGVFTGPGNRDIDFLGKAILVSSAGGIAENCVIDCQGSASDPHRGFLFQTRETGASELSAVKIVNGYGPENFGGGAAVCRYESSPTLSSCEFHESMAGYGGGLAIYGDCSPQLLACRFVGNDAVYGGGFSCRDWDSRPTLIDCLFLENTAMAGGAIHIDVAGPAFLGCDFIDNEGDFWGGGAAYLVDVFDFPSFDDCLFSGNSSHDDGGAILVNEGAPSFDFCFFLGNEAGEKGGAFATTNGGDTGFTNCTFFGNSGDDGGSALYLTSGSSHLVENCILSHGITGEAVLCEGGASATLVCTDVFGNESGDWVGCIAGQESQSGNLFEDPLYCDPPIGDFTLHLLSPCLPENNSCGVLMGAFGLGCGSTPARAVSWSEIKAIY